MRALLPITLSLALGLAAAGSALAAGPGPSPIGEMPTDRVIVRIKADGAAAKRAIPREEMAVQAGRALGEPLEFHRVMGDGAMVMRLQRRMTPSEIAARGSSFTVDGDTVEIEPDRIAFPQQSIPNDPFYGSQWNLKLEGIDLPPAWGVTTGSASLVIAILDTGMLGHPDLAGRYVAGYDFIGDTNRSNDATGRDPDATDPGDWVTAGESASGPLAGCSVTNSRWHGTLMAGVIAANGNNGIKIAGINWNSKLLPVRVVGKCGGYTSDIADGMRWAAGLSVPGVPANANPARVLNVSLAAASPTCDTTFANAIADVTTQKKATIVVSAGNFGASASQYSPGNCAGVITVGATDIRGGRPGYANTGDPIAISAPGGEGSGPGSVITLSDGGTTTALNDGIHVGTNGTSIAAAHVTGVASLLLSVRPSLTPAQVRDVLVTNARAFPANSQANGSFANCTTATCGAGIVDALAAITVLNDSLAGIPDVAAGEEHTLGLRTDGTVVAWGTNEWGQLGDGTQSARAFPVAVAGLDGVKRIAAGRFHSLAVRVDGSVWAWGRNDYGQLGNGVASGTPALAPVRAVGLRDVIAITAGEYHSVALTRDGRVWVWGDNSAASLGLGTAVDQPTPAQVPGITGAVAISAGKVRTCAAMADGSVRCWGFLGGMGLPFTATPVQVAGAGLATTLPPRADGDHLLMLSSSTPSVIRALGANEYGQLGGVAATAAPQPSPVTSINAMLAYSRLAIGRRHSVALATTGEVLAWGDNAEGQLGRGGAPGAAPAGGYSISPTAVVAVRSVVGIAAARDRAIAVRADGSVVAWGAGYLGNGPETVRGQTQAVRVNGPGGAGYLDLGAAIPPPDAFLSSNFYEKSDVPLSSLQVSNPVQLGGDPSFAVSFTMLDGDLSIGCNDTYLFTGALHGGDVFCLRTAAPSTPGTTRTAQVYAYGGLITREFRVTTTFADTVPDRVFPAPVAGIATGAQAVSSAVTITGTNAPANVVPAPGTEHSVGCTGSWSTATSPISGGQGLCLRGTAPASPGQTLRRGLTLGGMNIEWPVSSIGTGIHVLPAVRASNRSVLGLRDDGAAFGWGNGQTGQLGDGRYDRWELFPQDNLNPLPDPIAFAESPVAVGGTGTLKALALGPQHAVAAGADGTVWTWGRNDHGQAGNQTMLERSVPPYPIAISLPAAAVAVAAGAWHSVALDANGNVWTWGRNNEGQVGSACTTTRCTTPVQALGPGIVAIAAAGTTTYAINGAGGVYCWGRCYGSSFYQLQSAPTIWSAITGVKSIASTTGGHWLAVMLDGTVKAWGENEVGQIGNGTTLVNPAQQWTPVTVTGLSNVLQVATGGYDGRLDEETFFGAGYDKSHSLALKADGTVWGWGDNSTGQLGDGTQQQRTAPVQVMGVSGATGIAAGYRFSLALKGDGRVVAWGQEAFGEFGNGDNYTFTVSPLGSPITVAGVGGSGTLALGVADNTVFAPQTDVPVASIRTSNAIVVAVGGSVSISAGGSYSIGCNGTFVSTTGTINAGQAVCVRLQSATTLGTTISATLSIAGTPRIFTVTTIAGDATPDVFRFAPKGGQPQGTFVQSAPVTITGISGPVPVLVAGGEAAVPCGGAFTSNPGPVSPGQSICARLVTPSAFDALASATVTVGTRSAAFHVMTAPAPGFAVTPSVEGVTIGGGLRSDGTVYLWGDGNFGQLANGSNLYSTVPVPVAGLSGVKLLRTVRGHSLAIRGSDKTLWTWGRNDYGQLGDGTQVNSAVPVKVPTLANVKQAAGSERDSLALLEDGTVWAWGDNLFGQLGNGTTVGSSVPVQVSITNVKAIATGAGSLALKNDGTVWCWGFCLFSGGANVQSTPIQVAPAVLAGIEAIDGNGDNGHFLALKAGTVLAWGSNTYGQIGIGTTGITEVFPPVTVPGLSGVVQISTGGSHSMAIVDNAGTRTVWAWGSNEYGQLGLGTSPSDGGPVSHASPQRVAQADGASAVRAGAFNSFALRQDGGVIAWGIENFGVLGNGVLLSDRNQALPVPVLGVLGDGYLSLQFIDTSPDPFAFPARFGVEPGATVTSSTVRITGLSAASPVSITGGTYAKNCSGGFTGGLGSIANNETICVQVTAPGTFETSASATLTIGSGAGARSATFTVRTRRASGTAPISPQLALGNAHSLVLASNGAVNGVGYNANGQLGNGTTLNTPTPLRVPGFTGVRRVAAGAYHSLAVNANGTVSAWGYNAVGQLGLGVADSVRANPTPVPGLANVVAVAAGDYHSLALLQDGTVRAWGFNAYGQLGNGNTTNQSSPILVSGLANVIAIAAGGQHSLALLADGTLRAWGANDSGQLGDGTTTSKSTPAAVAGLSIPRGNAGAVPVAAIAAGTSHALALLESGTVRSWGANAQGQLGLGSTTASSTPVAVTALGANVGLIAAGGNHSLAVKAGGALFSWGANAQGQLGDGLNANRTTPFAIVAPAQATAVAAGARHSAAIDATGKVYLWGDNFFGQVGNRTGNFNPHSANLNVLRGDSRISTGAGGSGGGTGTASSAGSAVLNLGGLGGGYSFGSLAVGQPASAPVNYQNVAATDPIGSLGFSASGAGFSTSGSCPNSLGPAETCSFSLDFSAASPGFYTGQLRIDSDLVGAPEIREIDATAVTAQSAALALAASAVQFPPTLVGTVSASQSITVTNAGTATLSVTAANSSSPAFGITNGCASVAPGASCTIAFTYAPSVTGIASATVTLESNGGNAALVVGGTGIAANYDIAPDTFSFPAAPNVALGGIVTSAPVVISGIGGPSPISVQGGEYSVGCTGTFTSAAGTIANGQTVCVRHQASATISTTVTTTLTIGGISGIFSSTTTATPPSNPARLGNISTRMQVLTGNDVLIGGFIIGGNQAKTVVVRARGPSLAPAGITNFLANPKLDLYSGQTVIASNDDWGTAANAAALQSSGFAPANAQEAAILITLGPGAYTAIVSGVGGTTGVGIVEVFEVDLPQVPLLNISTRGQVLTNNDVMIGGFIIMGDAPQTVIVRARGPSLAPFGITNFLANPVLQLFSGQTQIAVNDNWQSAANAAEIQSRGFAPANAFESAILITLNPGAYTAIVTGAGGTTGVGIIEVFAQ